MIVLVFLLFVAVSNALSSCDSYCASTYPGQSFPANTITPLENAFQQNNQIVFTANVTSLTIAQATITYTLERFFVYKVCV